MPRRALIQRVADASVTVDGRVTGQIGAGLLVLVCAMQGDNAATAEKLAARVAKLRIFRDEGGKMNRSLLDTGGAGVQVAGFDFLQPFGSFLSCGIGKHFLSLAEAGADRHLRMLLDRRRAPCRYRPAGDHLV